ncbi:hypothetical protein CPB83DRAFT_847418 [Crepidotus variabilis]|uniref:Cytidyltransferase-like domain-containing protein n=1 Tax=Crepidotus variabilis TaxID=179855 RepID=A0A9P6ENP6_9AGAR|nr:hypothetical protein CPB83DRAFT_847418 [Crepidotus variabilis]
MDNILLEVNVLLKGLNEDLEPNLGDGIDVCYRISGDAIAVPLPGSISSLPQSYIPVSGPYDLAPTTITPSSSPSPSSSNMPPSFPNTALGGTFDHLHAGHKILLSMAAWITHSKLIVGLTSDVLLVSKSYASVLESFSTRSARVSSFVEFFKPGLTIDIQAINDVYGPTGWDPDIQALVVSKETLNGGEKIRARRKEKNLPALKTFLIDVVSATSASLEHEDVEWLKENKLSSTEVRRWIVAKEKGKQGAEEVEKERSEVGKELIEVLKNEVT